MFYTVKKVYEYDEDDNETLLSARIMGKSPEKNPIRGHEYGVIEGDDFAKAKAVIVNGLIEIAEDADAITVSDAYKVMDEGVQADGKAIFGSGRIDTMLAEAIEYIARVLNPAHYSGLGLTAGLALGSFAVGDALDTDQKIIDYHTAVLLDLSDKRNAKKATYIAARNSIG